MDILTYLAGYIQARQIPKFVKCNKCCDIVNQSNLIDTNLSLLNAKKWGNILYNKQYFI